MPDDIGITLSAHHMPDDIGITLLPHHMPDDIGVTLSHHHVPDDIGVTLLPHHVPDNIGVTLSHHHVPDELESPRLFERFVAKKIEYTVIVSNSFGAVYMEDIHIIYCVEQGIYIGSNIFNN